MKSCTEKSVLLRNLWMCKYTQTPLTDSLKITYLSIIFNSLDYPLTHRLARKDLYDILEYRFNLLTNLQKTASKLNMHTGLKPAL